MGFSSLPHRTCKIICEGCPVLNRLGTKGNASERRYQWSGITLVPYFFLCSGEVSQIHRTCEWQAEVSGTVNGLKSTSSSIHKIFIEHLFCARQCSKHCGYHISVSKTEGPACVDLSSSWGGKLLNKKYAKAQKGSECPGGKSSRKGDGEGLVRFK